LRRSNCVVSVAYPEGQQRVNIQAPEDAKDTPGASADYRRIAMCIEASIGRTLFGVHG